MRVYPWNGPVTVADLEEQGIWLGSELGVSFVCACNWRTGIHATPAEVRTLMEAHLNDAHAGISERATWPV